MLLIYVNHNFFPTNIYLINFKFSNFASKFGLFNKIYTSRNVMKIILRTLILALLFVTPIATIAQNTEGKVIDKDGNAISYATVTLLKADSTFLCGTTSDDDGHYTLPQQNGAALLRVSYVGYKTVTIPFDATRKSITLSEEDNMLQDVEVVSMRQLVKNEGDRLAYNMEADPESKTNTLLDMLQKVPMVSVDGENNVRVKGSTSFKYYKNGHPDPSLSGNPKEVLRSIPAYLVKRIEVITDPGAKYDAEGATAILNIVMVSGSSLSHLTGTVSAGINTFWAPNANIYVAGQTGKLTLSGYYTYQTLGKHQQETYQTTEQTFTSSDTRNVGSSTNRQPATIHGANVSASYEIDSLNLLSASFSGYNYDLDINGTGSSAYYNADGSLFSSYDTRFHIPSYSGKSWNGQFDYEHRTRLPNEVLTLSYMFATTGNNQDRRSDYENTFSPLFSYTGYDVWLKERFTEHTFQIDYARPFLKFHKLEVGAKYILRYNRSHTKTTYDGAEDLNTDNRFNHDTQVAAAYASWMYNRGKLSLRDGIRYEYSFLSAKYPNGDGENFKTNLNDIVPSASVNWNFDDFKSLRLSFSTSINRPGISYLNPAVKRDASSVSFGNAQLSSSRNTSLTLTYQQVGQKITFNVSPYLTITNNLIGEDLYAIDNIKYQTYSNGNRYRNFGIEGFVQWMLTKTTTLAFNGIVSHKYYRNPSLDLENSGWTSNIYTQITQQLPWKIRATGTFMCLGIGHDVSNLYSYTNIPTPLVNLRLQRSFLKEDRLTVQLGVVSMFNKYMRMNTKTTQGDYIGSSTFKNRWQQLTVSISYRFGKSNAQVKKVERSIENTDVVGGIKNATGGKEN